MNLTVSRVFLPQITNGSMGALTQLVLEGNQIGDSGLQALAGAIGNGSMGELAFLYLHRNPISEATKTKIRTAASNQNFNLVI
jgi:hypothetical protein